VNLPTCQIWNEDCIRGLAERLDPESVHLTVTSIPFESLFVYTGKNEDLGNNPSDKDLRAGRFALNLRFFAEQLFRVTATGCNACIHIQQLLAYKNTHGFMGRRDFKAAVVDVFGAARWVWAGEFVIPKDPQILANRLNLHSLQFKSGYARSSTIWAPAVNDYVLVFHKEGDCAVPVRPLKHKTNPGGWIDEEDWIRDARGVWTDIDEIDVLDGARSNRCRAKFTEQEAEKHVCPLQLTVIRRLVRLYSNPASLQPDVQVLDPFMGIGSTAVVAIEEGRNALGFELKDSYHRTALGYVAAALRRVEHRAREASVPTLHELAEGRAEGAGRSRGRRRRSSA